jgi:hypothetical protein
MVLPKKEFPIVIVDVSKAESKQSNRLVSNLRYPRFQLRRGIDYHGIEAEYCSTR